MSYTEALEALAIVSERISAQGRVTDDRLEQKRRELMKLVNEYEDEAAALLAKTSTF
jgi:hypothetical protein